MLVPAILCGVACIVIGVPFTYYWLRLSDRWAEEDQKRFHRDRSDEADTETRVIGRDDNGDGG